MIASCPSISVVRSKPSELTTPSTDPASPPLELDALADTEWTNAGQDRPGDQVPKRLLGREAEDDRGQGRRVAPDAPGL
jgi:hypothetical protein